MVTKQLVGCFDAALGLIKSALEQRSSKAAYLHGSFGNASAPVTATLTALTLRLFRPQEHHVPNLPMPSRRPLSWVSLGHLASVYAGLAADIAAGLIDALLAPGEGGGPLGH